MRWDAAKELYKAWNYDLLWSTLIGADEFGRWRTRMGHAEYMEGGEDFDPTVASPFDSPEQVLSFDPMESLGPRDVREIRRRFEQHYRHQVAEGVDAVRMTGIYITCISGLIDLFGWELLLTAAGVDPERFGQLTNRYSEWISQYFVALAESDVPVVMVHDDMVWTSGPFIHPDWYHRFVFPNLKRHFAPIVESGKRLLFTSDGNYTAFIDDLVDCGVQVFVMEPTTDMAALAERYGKDHGFIGNADTRVLLSGTKEQIRVEVERCMAIGKPHAGFVMAVGNHIPPNTPVENALYYNECYEALARR